jgi:putative transposase
MLLGLTYQLVLFVVDLVLVRTSPDAQLRAEVLALRHQLCALERKVGKPAWQPGDRILLAGLSRLLPRSGLSSLLPMPETLLRWHRDLVRHKWAAFAQRPPRRQPATGPPGGYPDRTLTGWRRRACDQVRSLDNHLLISGCTRTRG